MSVGTISCVDGCPYNIINQILQKPNTLNTLKSKNNTNPQIEKFCIKIAKISHSIKNFTKVGKPLNIKILNQITTCKMTVNVARPDISIKFRV
jgi:hypothetical protein